MRQRSITTLAVGLVLTLASMACEEESNLVTPSGAEQRTEAVAAALSRSKQARLITSDRSEFAEALDQVGNENEVQIVLKDPLVPRIAREVFKVEPGLPIGLPPSSADVPRRMTRSFEAAPSQQIREELIRELESRGADIYRVYRSAPVLSIRLEERHRAAVLRYLFNHPAVDFMEANKRRKMVKLTAEAGGATVPVTRPLESLHFERTASIEMVSPIDDKHAFHRVKDLDAGTEDAWDFTRGSGIRIGVLDKGMAGEFPGTGWHAYAALLSASEGVEKLGFADDYNACSVQDQEIGACEARDDDGHGTFMAGLAGANDNNSFVVGIAPEALTISLKFSINCSNPDTSGGCEEFEDDDFQAAVDWASDNNLDILSMSFAAPGLSTTSEFFLQAAYNGSDILLLAGTGNESDSGFPAPMDEVMGVGGLKSDGTSVWSNANEEVSGLSGGMTLRASCNSIDFCTPVEGTAQKFFSVTQGSGGTSASTAIAAGIAALVRSHNPSLTASQVRQRLVNTADGIHRQLNAWRAVTNTPRLGADILGPTSVEGGSFATWTAAVTNGVPPLSYTWREFDGFGATVVGTDSTYTRWVDESDSGFTLILDVTDAVGQSVTEIESVDVNSGEGGSGEDGTKDD